MTRRFEGKPCSILTSLVLETPPESLSDSLGNIYVTGVEVDPPAADQVFVHLTSYGYYPKGPEFMKVELKDPHAVGQAMQGVNNQGFAHWVSPLIRLPPQKSPENRHGAVAMFSMPKSFYDRKLQVFISVKDERDGFVAFPNATAASAALEGELKKMHFSGGGPMLFPLQAASTSPVYSFMG